MDGRRIYNVLPSDTAAWRVERVDGPAIAAQFTSEEEAVRETKRFAKAHPPSVVRVHDREGRVTAEFEYD